MIRTEKRLNTLDHVLMLLEKESTNILKRENANENLVHLYGVGEFWAAFDRSAFMLEQMTNQNSDAAILRLKDYPFPVLMYCVHYEKVKDLCRKHIMKKRGLEYLQFLTHPIDTDSYNKWYRDYVVDEE